VVFKQVANHENPFCLYGLRIQRNTLVIVDGERLLDENVLTLSKGVTGQRVMSLSGCGNRDGVDGGIVNHLLRPLDDPGGRRKFFGPCATFFRRVTNSGQYPEGMKIPNEVLTPVSAA